MNKGLISLSVSLILLGAILSGCMDQSESMDIIDDQPEETSYDIPFEQEVPHHYKIVDRNGLSN